MGPLRTQKKSKKHMRFNVFHEAFLASDIKKPNVLLHPMHVQTKKLNFNFYMFSTYLDVYFLASASL